MGAGHCDVAHATMKLHNRDEFSSVDGLGGMDDFIQAAQRAGDVTNRRHVEGLVQGKLGLGATWIVRVLDTTTGRIHCPRRKMPVP